MSKETKHGGYKTFLPRYTTSKLDYLMIALNLIPLKISSFNSKQEFPRFGRVEGSVEESSQNDVLLLREDILGFKCTLKEGREKKLKLMVRVAEFVSNRQVDQQRHFTSDPAVTA